MNWVSHLMKFGWVILGRLGSFDTNKRAYIIWGQGILLISACHVASAPYVHALFSQYVILFSPLWSAAITVASYHEYLNGSHF